MMQKIKIEGTYLTPEIILNPKEGLILTAGRYLLKYPERENFKQKVLLEIAGYMESKPTNTKVNIYHEYVNTGNLKAYFEIFKTIDKYSNEYPVTFNWYYEPEDEDSLEIGQLLTDQLKTEVNFIEIE